jgi:rare lipoprotein A
MACCRAGFCPVLLELLFAVALAGCSFGPWPPAPELPPQGPHQGIASWYGPGFDGRSTSSGEIYDRYGLTAAHPSLPLGTRVRVTNLGNGRSVDLRINDRGPFVKGRVIDLSYTAARELGVVGPGTAEVRVEPISDDGVPVGIVSYAVQTGAFSDGARAAALRRTLAAEPVYLSLLETPASLYYRVRVGPFQHREEAVAKAQDLARLGLPAMVVEEVAP